jgi:hypothetical protein
MLPLARSLRSHHCLGFKHSVHKPMRDVSYSNHNEIQTRQVATTHLLQSLQKLSKLAYPKLLVLLGLPCPSLSMETPIEALLDFPYSCLLPPERHLCFPCGPMWHVLTLCKYNKLPFQFHSLPLYSIPNNYILRTYTYFRTLKYSQRLSQLLRKGKLMLILINFSFSAIRATHPQTTQPSDRQLHQCS